MKIKTENALVIARFLLRKRTHGYNTFYATDQEALRPEFNVGGSGGFNKRYTFATIDRYFRAYRENYGGFEVVDKSSTMRQITADAADLLKLIRSLTQTELAL